MQTRTERKYNKITNIRRSILYMVHFIRWANLDFQELLGD